MSLSGGSSKQFFSKSRQIEVMGLGMEMRARASRYPELIGIPRSVYYQTNNITTTLRSMGMPTGSLQNMYSRITGTSGSALQISSSNVNDTSAGSGAITIYIDGIFIDSNGDWFNRTTFSSPTTLNGQTAVQIGTLTDWYRINKIWVLTAGSGETNAGDLYISPNGQALTAGVPTAMTLCSVIAGYSNSTGGFFSTATAQRFNYTKGNFWIDEGKAIELHEFFYQSFSGSGNTADMVKYEVGIYPSISTSYDYTGAAPYTEKTDIGMEIRTTTGSADAASLYVEYVLTDDNRMNL